MLAEMQCAGAPRDLGLAQGRSCAGAVRRGAPRLGWLARLRPSRRQARLDRDLWRHHPQLAERLRGLALGAGVPAAALLRALADDTEDAPVLAVERPGGPEAGPPAGPLLARLLPGLDSEAAREGWILRRSRPDPGFASLEIARPWLPAGAAGVNEAGLAAVASGFVADPEDGGSPAPGFLLVQGALQRFARTPGAVEWLLRRPGGGRGAVLVADAEGDVAGVSFAGPKRRALTAEEGIVSGGAEAGGAIPRSLLAKAAREGATSAEHLARALCAAAPGTGCLVLDPAARRLVVLLEPEARARAYEISGGGLTG